MQVNLRRFEVSSLIFLEIISNEALSILMTINKSVETMIDFVVAEIGMPNNVKRGSGFWRAPEKRDLGKWIKSRVA